MPSATNGAHLMNSFSLLSSPKKHHSDVITRIPKANNKSSSIIMNKTSSSHGTAVNSATGSPLLKKPGVRLVNRDEEATILARATYHTSSKNSI